MQDILHKVVYCKIRVGLAFSGLREGIFWLVCFSFQFGFVLFWFSFLFTCCYLAAWFCSPGCSCFAQIHTCMNIYCREFGGRIYSNLQKLAT